MQKRLYIYHCHICKIGGVETFLYNFCVNLRNYYDITILYSNGDISQIQRLQKLVKLEKYNPSKEYECDIFIRNSVWRTVPTNVVSKDNRYIEMRHANYKFLLDKGKLFQQYHKFDKTNEVIGCGEFVSKMSNEVLKDNPKTILNILEPKKNTNKVLHLISCTRLDSEKGWNRMLKMASMLRNEKIKFRWDIFTNDFKKHNFEEIHFYSPRFDIWDYIADADYTVLLSDCEGLPYTVQESLQYKTPCIVTDVEGCTELIKDGINGYVVPLDMNFDIKKILKIPKCNDYENNSLEKWLEYLGDSEYIEKEYWEMRKFKVKAIKNFTYGEYDSIEFIEKQNVNGTWIYIGDIFLCSEEQKNYLTGDNRKKTVAVEVVEVIEEKKPVKEEIVEEPKEEAKPKKTTKKNTKK